MLVGVEGQPGREAYRADARGDLGDGLCRAALKPTAGAPVRVAHEALACVRAPPAALTPVGVRTPAIRPQRRLALAAHAAVHPQRRELACAHAALLVVRRALALGAAPRDDRRRPA